jgi:hypothetical protein
LEKNKKLKCQGTICFLPSNNLNTILPIISDLFPILGQGWKILVVTSDRHKKQKAFKKLNDMCKNSSLVDTLFIKKGVDFQKVIPMANKVLSVIKFVKTPYITFFSSTEKPSLTGLSNIAKTMSENKDTAAIRGQIIGAIGIDKKRSFSDQFFEIGEGISQFGLESMSPSGIVYDTSALNQTFILSKFEKKLRAHKDYPFAYLNILLATNFKTALVKDPVGTEIEELNSKIDKMSEYFSPCSYGQRCDQFIALRNALLEGFIDVSKLNDRKNIKLEDLYFAVETLCTRLCTLMAEENGRIYREQMMGMELTLKSFAMFCISGVEQFPEYAELRVLLKNKLFPKIHALMKNIIESDKVSEVAHTNNGSSIFYSRAQSV